MLQYRENVNYMVSDNNSIDDQLKQLNQLCSKGISDYQLYEAIRNYIYKEIKIKQLAVTLILDDLMKIRQYNPTGANIISFFITHNDFSYKDVADWFGCSKQYIHQLMQKYSQQYIWLDNLIKIKGAEDSKNENNRSIFFNQNNKKKKQQKLIQLSLILLDDEVKGDNA